MNKANKDIYEEGDERFSLFIMGNSVAPVERLPKRREGHIVTDSGYAIPATRGLNRPWVRSGATFRRGADHVHPASCNGWQDDHDWHVLQETEPNSRTSYLLRLFRKAAKNF